MSAPYPSSGPSWVPMPPQPVLPPTRAARPAGLGITALVLVLVALAASAGTAWIGATRIVDLTYRYSASGAIPDAEASALGWLGLSQGLWALLGLAALILGIIATATGRGRWFGVAAIVLAVLGPGITFGVFFAVANTVAEHGPVLGT
ncbi:MULTISPECIES: hypothetical protein [unclassified Leucobacter]|uniref:hypothetical protein n=1 Tax=unclassified Leucobacter TaxID=2621730 RepID=UPI0012E02CE5|nr:hypothetical protein [Leucobacter sp. Ag1]